MVSVTDIDAEELVLSAIIDGDKQNIADIMSRVKDDDFFFKGNRKLFSLLRGMYAAGEPISPEEIAAIPEDKDLAEFLYKRTYGAKK